MFHKAVISYRKKKPAIICDPSETSNDGFLLIPNLQKGHEICVMLMKISKEMIWSKAGGNCGIKPAICKKM
ncbi:hypothetical protein XELAEV_18001670mg [Xenopus laevis]|uniref:Uncharacterized protein n=1 Tax=Xenopus laevis TaxID=8355 RepID=A0A974GYQ8_XENLA|nr:hypothetical protein XELAEV_18001670mg [Xenopus laevis]